MTTESLVTEQKGELAQSPKTLSSKSVDMSMEKMGKVEEHFQRALGLKKMVDRVSSRRQIDVKRARSSPCFLASHSLKENWSKFLLFFYFLRKIQYLLSGITLINHVVAKFTHSLSVADNIKPEEKPICYPKDAGQHGAGVGTGQQAVADGPSSCPAPAV